MSVLKTSEADIDLADNGKIKLGDSNDLQIFHSGTESIIEDSGTGSLVIKANSLFLRKFTNSEKYIDCNSNGSVDLYYDGATKLATTSTGVAVSGQVNATSFVGDGITPTGTILTFAGNGAIPAGFVACNGASLSRTAYSDLLAVLTVLYGSTSTTFKVPDLRDEFLRGWGSGRAIGSTQGHDWKGFTLHGTGNNSYSHTSYMGKTTGSYSGNWFAGHWNTTANRMTLKWDGSEIRPRNIAMIFIIKY